MHTFCILNSNMDIHTMQHFYIVWKNIRTRLIDTTLYLRDVYNSCPQLLNSWSWFLEIVATTFKVVATTCKHFIASIALLCHFVAGDHNFWNSKVMAMSFKSRGRGSTFTSLISDSDNPSCAFWERLPCLWHAMKPQYMHHLLTEEYQQYHCVLLLWHGYLPLLGRVKMWCS